MKAKVNEDNITSDISATIGGLAMTKEEAINKLVENGWDLKKAKRKVKQILDKGFPLEQVNLTIEMEKCKPIERIYYFDENGNWVDEEK